ncbi:MAG: type III pantothenate kinase [Thermodesulfovibrionia bacterium]|nr:type III pantothenate kinase [Thermodesulfovibrionia bacterium]
MLFLIDAGNTSLKACFYDKGARDVLRLSTAVVRQAAADELCGMLKDFFARQKDGNPEGAVISSVVTDATPLLADAVRKVFSLEPVIVDHVKKTGLKLHIKNPESVGSDRLANAAAANRFYKGHKIIVDFGTATTFSVVTEEGGFRGGVIMPGIDISAKALASNTSKLPEIDIKAPEKILGDNTTDAILSGIIIGHAGAVDRIIEDIEKETGLDYTVIVTGGRADMMAPYIRSKNNIDPDLAFKGLKAIYDLNS